MAKVDWQTPANRDRICRVILRRASWQVRAAERGDEAAVLELCRQLFGTALTSQEWNWRMFQNPAGEAFGLIAFLKDSPRIVGHLAALPIDLKVGDCTRKLFFLVDSVVDPVYRGRGIHAVLTMAASRQASERDGGFMGGLPNLQAYTPNLKMGGTHLFTMPVFFKLLDWRALLRRAAPSPLPSRFLNAAQRKTPTATNQGFAVDEVSTFGEEMNQLWRRVSPQFAVAAVRNAAFLNWRYFQRPDAPYRVLSISRDGQWFGYVVIRMMEKWKLRLGIVADLFFDLNSPEAGEVLFSRAEDLLRADGAAALWTLFAAPQTYQTLFRKARLFRLPSIKGVRQFHFVADFVTVDHERVDLTQRDGALLRNPTNWFFAPGDTDLV